MGYMRIVQYGDITEVYEYEKNRTNNPPKVQSPLQKKRQNQIRKELLKKGLYVRSDSSIQRAIKSFYRLCHHNNTIATSIHFLTLTFAYDLSYKTATRHVARFMERLQRDSQEIPIHYISVPEKTKKGRYHFHILLYNYPREKGKNERSSRYLQRLFERGFVDLRFATYTSKGIAGYMAKYMAKSFGDIGHEAVRFYNCSRGLPKPTSYGSNSLSSYSSLITPEGDCQKREYDVPYLGKCILSIISKK